MKITRILFSKNLNLAKYDALENQALLLGKLRSEIWQRFGSVSGTGVSDREIRNQWMSEKRNFSPLSVNAWKETLRDSIADIRANRESTKAKARQAIRRHTSDKEEQKRLYILLKYDKWTEEKYLTRIMRKYWSRGHNHTYNQIIIRSDDYTTFIRNNQAWISVPSLIKGKRISIPMSSNIEPVGTLRLILRNNQAEIHYSVDAEIQKDCGDKIIGVDKGFTESLVDSDGIHYGEGLGKLISDESDYLKKKNKNRNKLYRIAKKSKPDKKTRIEKNNLGIKKKEARAEKKHKEIRTLVFTETHRLVDKAAVLIAEDLTSPICKKSFGKNMNRKLSAWTKGVIAESLNTVSQRRSSSLHLINPAYTSQIDNRTGCFTGKRKGDLFYCEDGVVLQADENAAKNILARFYDSEISLWTDYKTVKSILLKRTDSYRLGLLNLDSSCKPSSGLSTESELPFD